MGRTLRKRKRKRKIPHTFHTCNGEKDLILFNSWLAKQGVRCSKKLVLAIFDDTGRGVLTKQKIIAGKELMNLPLNLTINVSSLLMDNTFCSIFVENRKACLLDYKKSVSFQSLMAFYLVYLKAQGSCSKWYVYLESLPKTYTVPYFLPNSVKKHIHNEILDVITNQKTIIDSSYKTFNEILMNTLSSNCVVRDLTDYFSLAEYEWAYFTVNTRCVYMDLSKLIDLKNASSTILALTYDNTKISLCPYLDMINHNPNTRNETKLMINKDLHIMPIVNLKEHIFSEVRFSIYTKNNFDPYTEVYICYGDSHNLKLITEYGFYLPSNDMDCVIFDFDTIVTYFTNTIKVKLSSDQTSFILNHGFNKDLYIDLKGLSFNFYGFLMAVKYYYNKDMDISRLLYSAAIRSNDQVLLDLVKPLAKHKLLEISKTLDKLQSYRKCIILDNCIQLICQYIKILKKFIEC